MSGIDRITMRPRQAAAILWLLLPALLSAAPQAPVAIFGNETTFTLDNGIVTAQAAKRSGDLTSLKYQGLEMLNAQSGRPGGYWSHNVARGEAAARITIDPQSNGGERGEVAFRGTYHGTPLGSGPGGSVAADIEIRYALGRGDSGLYTYSVFEHATNYPATSVGEARYCAKLNDELFDWMTVDGSRNRQMMTAYDWNHGTVMNLKEARRMNSGVWQGQVEHKYDYSANQFDVRAWGWTSTGRGVGLWFVNPSVEYLSGGPTKVELSAHRDATFGTDPKAPAPPTLLNYWRGSHYGGSVCSVAAGEAWTKVIGPFLIYCNSGSTRDALWQDALAQAEREAAAWPYDWVAGVDYPHRAARGTVTGRLTLDDAGAPEVKMTHLLAGLAAPDYVPGRGEGGPRGGGGVAPRAVQWQDDAKHYEFWARADAGGNFTIRNVRPGAYTLHAIADGVLGEFALTNVAIRGGQAIEVGELRWRPIRYGKQIWDIGIPNRTGAEFCRGSDYFHWGWYLEYPRLFPHDVNYVIGQSDFRRDWFFEQVPHNEDPANTTGSGNGRATTWSIAFELPNAPRGTATLRLALACFDARALEVSVNDRPVGRVTGLASNGAVRRDGIGGYWSECALPFAASLMKAGPNVMKLTIPAGSLTSGIIYDYLRLELDEAAVPAGE